MFDRERIEKNCLRCKHFRLVDTSHGKCRIDRVTLAELPTRGLEESCERWQDSGQQYFVRRGWLKGQREKA